MWQSLCTCNNNNNYSYYNNDDYFADQKTKAYGGEGFPKVIPNK